jgi:predicted DNA-binding transcriptional regulator YafY
VEKGDGRIRWGTEKRLEFIEFRLFWEGGVNRSDITEFFGVSVPQASKDLTQYRELAPANIQYDASEKRYLATPSFKPRFLKPDPDRYLNQLRTIADRIVPADETWLAHAPQAEAMPVPHRRIDMDVLRALLDAIERKQSIEVHYQSMNEARPERVWRRISPHALGHDGLRWHVRAYCHIESKFKDFILSRIFAIRGEDVARASGAQDTFWATYFTVVLQPNPKLSEGQQDAVAAEHGMVNRRVEVSLRKAMLYYFEKRMRLDLFGQSKRPQEVPLVIGNRAAFEAALKDASA